MRCSGKSTGALSSVRAVVLDNSVYRFYLRNLWIRPFGAFHPQMAAVVAEKTIDKVSGLKEKNGSCSIFELICVICVICGQKSLKLSSAEVAEKDRSCLWVVPVAKDQGWRW